MDMKIELVVIPVADVDRAKTFYVETLGWHGDVDVQPAPGVRVVQVTPPASACSIGFGSGIPVYDAASPAARRRRSRQMRWRKNGTPTSDVTTPTLMSVVAGMTRTAMSAAVRRAAPASALGQSSRAGS